jgi:hypothetical protein
MYYEFKSIYYKTLGNRPMKVLKGFALGISGFLFFLSLSVFGLAFMLNSTALNPRFISAEVNRLDISSLVEEIVSEQPPSPDFPAEMQTALIQTVDSLEPKLKQEVGAAVSSIYDYLLGKTKDLNLALVLKDTILNEEFIASLVEEADVTSSFKQYLKEQLTEGIPPDQQYLVPYLDEAIPTLEPWIEEQASIVVGPVVDYVLGESQTLRVVISLEPMKAILRTSTREAFLKSPPPELAAASLAELDRYFNDYYQQFVAEIPATIEIDESALGPDVPASTAQALADTEEELAQARHFISYFQLGYKLLIVFILLLILGIVLIYRQVRGATRDLGITFLTCGALEYIGILIGKYFLRTYLPLADLPSSLQSWLPQLAINCLRPLEMLSLGLAIGGIVLIIVSFVYKPRPALP